MVDYAARAISASACGSASPGPPLVCRGMRSRSALKSSAKPRQKSPRRNLIGSTCSPRARACIDRRNRRNGPTNRLVKRIRLVIATGTRALPHLPIQRPLGPLALGHPENRIHDEERDRSGHCSGTWAQTKPIVEKTFAAIIDALAKEGRVELRGFGVFECGVEKPAKPETHVPARRSWRLRNARSSSSPGRCWKGGSSRNARLR